MSRNHTLSIVGLSIFHTQQKHVTAYCIFRRSRLKISPIADSFYVILIIYD